MSELDRQSVAAAEGRHATTRITATVNGRQVSREVPIHYRLIDFVREELKLTGNKEGCGAGECGTCSMFVDGKLVKSCLTPVQKIQGAKVETIDDLDRDHGMTVVQRAFHKCGCQPVRLLHPGHGDGGDLHSAPQSRRRPRRDQGTPRRQHLPLHRIPEDLRCGGAGPRRPQRQHSPSPRSPRTTGHGASSAHSTRPARRAGQGHGRLKYAGDMWMPNMLHMQVLRSPHPHARIVRIDTTAADAPLPGVECVHHLRRRAGRRQLRRVRRRPADHGARRGALRRRGGGGGGGRDLDIARAARRADQGRVRARCRRCSIRDEAMRPGPRAAARLRREQHLQAHPSARATSKPACGGRPGRRGDLSDRSRSSTPTSSPKPAWPMWTPTAA